MLKAAKKKIPYDFVLNELTPLKPLTKPMFGCVAIYLGEKILFILREKEKATEDNGVWVATLPEHHESLRKDFPALRSIYLFGGGETTWQNLPAECDEFEESAIRLCELALRRDPRIGKIPNSRKAAKGKRKAKQAPAKKGQAKRPKA